MENTVLYTLSIGKSNVKGRKNELQESETDKQNLGKNIFFNRIWWIKRISLSPK